MSRAEKFKVLVPVSTRAALAEKVGCSKLHLQRVLAGRVAPSNALLKKLAEALAGRVKPEEWLSD